MEAIVYSEHYLCVYLCVRIVTVRVYKHMYVCMHARYGWDFKKGSRDKNAGCWHSLSSPPIVEGDGTKVQLMPLRGNSDRDGISWKGHQLGPFSMTRSNR